MLNYLNRISSNIKKKINQVEWHNPLREAGHKFWYLEVISLLVVYQMSKGSAILLVAFPMALLILQLLMYIFCQCGGLKYYWRIFLGTTISTNMFPHHLCFINSHNENQYLQSKECSEWLQSSIKHSYYYITPECHVVFFWKRDAMMFKLAWGGQGGMIV